MISSMQLSNLVNSRKISNITNSNDPKSVNSRIFVGNLNTFTLTKDDVETIFKRYGRIIGISMHKGYAFVQYTNEYDARNAVSGEDQRVYASQQVDVNMASEPKPNRPSRKRPQGAGAEWDYYYNVPVVPGRGPLAMPLPLPLKRPRPDLATALITPPGIPPNKKRNLIPVGKGAGALVNGHLTGPGRRVLPKPRGKAGTPQKIHPKSGQTNNETPDILICGNCRQFFSTVEELSDHKQVNCKLRFVCKCSDSNGKHGGEPLSLVCSTCQVEFSSCWELCQHCQNDHGLSLYDETKLNMAPGSSCSDTASQTSQNIGDDASDVTADVEVMGEPEGDQLMYDPEAADEDVISAGETVPENGEKAEESEIEASKAENSETVQVPSPEIAVNDGAP